MPTMASTSPTPSTSRQRLALTVSGRFNAALVDLNDQNGGDLTGNHSYNHFNPAAGVTYQVTPWLTAYAGYAVANRAPTPAELSCAGPPIRAAWPISSSATPISSRWSPTRSRPACAAASRRSMAPISATIVGLVPQQPQQRHRVRQQRHHGTRLLRQYRPDATAGRRRRSAVQERPLARLHHLLPTPTQRSRAASSRRPAAIRRPMRTATSRCSPAIACLAFRRTRPSSASTTR